MSDSDDLDVAALITDDVDIDLCNKCHICKFKIESWDSPGFSRVPPGHYGVSDADQLVDLYSRDKDFRWGVMRMIVLDKRTGDCRISGVSLIHQDLSLTVPLDQDDGILDPVGTEEDNRVFKGDYVSPWR
ncbi:predicted protein [Aspergillus terreus NIH2624]|uniref:Uncharacterized protein n=1 Tax=Aspergillus terreus (strain NIH 2624 / FGSC A1156) TaxID=341663 RepID=Q0CD46_ASPTN|nr:uncharacterized protein ATEG_08388 [Aspergillus terreus NIH2624]EAU31561.1 predicted protein [Aspergillus terreus NIH2624]